MKICIWGDSISRGAFDYDQGGRVNRLHKRGLKNDNYIYNFSVSSNDTRGVLYAMEKQIDIIENIEPEDEYIYIFAIGSNDARYINNKENKVVPISEFRSNLNQIINLSKNITNKIIFLGINQIDENKTKPIPREPTEYYENDDLKEYNKCIEEICKSNNIDLISMRNLLTPSNFEDGLHPDPKNHKIIYDAVKEYIIDNKII
ncbi:MAG TPA: GDSL-type esterase/lipase family protein [Candidatus Absconditabacterales bacterium]|nr:GDSL-type esterase/lipase family protein [Candidatus Absconditabacterales bacterium]